MKHCNNANAIQAMLRVGLLMTVVASTLIACAALQRTEPPKVTVVGVEPAQGEGLEARMQLKLRVQNPNSTAIDYNGVYVELKVLDKDFGSGVSDASGTVPPFGEALISVPVSVSVLGLVGQAVGMLGGGKLPDKAKYELHGKLNSPTSGALRFKSEGELTLPSSLSGAG
jgi:LEA14-like dessication related protein